MVNLTLWNGCREAARFKLESTEAAIEHVKTMAADPGRYPKHDGWSISDEHWCWIIENGEEMAI